MAGVEAMFERYGPKYRWLVTLSVLLGLVALGMSITIVNVATPYMKGAFGMSSDQVQWLSTGFLAATTVSLLVSPWLMEAFGQRATYVGLLAVFILASVVGGLATGMTGIVVARIVQGAMTGVVRPVALDALFSVFPREQRGMATAVYGMSLGLPLTLASVVGGYLVEHLGWRYVFFIVIPFCVAGMVMGWLFLPTREQSGERPPLDWVGVLAAFGSIFTLLAAIANGQRWGWGNTAILQLEAVSIVLLVFFIVWELRHPRPLLDLAIFRSKAFLAGSIVLLLFGGAFYGVMYLLPLFMNGVLHYSPITSGMLFTPSTLVLAILVPLVGWLSDRVSPHWLLLPGLVLAIWAVLRMAEVDWNTSFWSLASSMAILSAAMAALPPPTLARSLAALPRHLMGYGSGAINFALQLGGAFGTVVLVAMVDRRTLLHSDHLTAGLNAANPVARETLDRIGSMLGHAGTSQAYADAGARYVLGAMDRVWAVIGAYQDGFMAIAFALGVVIIPALMLSYWGVREQSTAAE